MDAKKTVMPKLMDVTWEKQIITKGIWGNRPRESAKCIVIFENIVTENVALEEVQQGEISSYLSSDFDNTLVIGDADTDVDRCIDKALRSMLKCEVSLFIISFVLPLHCSDTASSLGNGAIKCTVLLKEIYNEPYIFEWSHSKKYEVAMQHKIRGVELYKSGRTRDAFLRFSKGLKLLITMTLLEEIEYSKDDILALHAVLCNNIASCHLLYKNYSEALKMCNKVLQIELKNVKALFRRASAEIELQNYEQAKQDLSMILEMEPENRAVRMKLNELSKRQKEFDAKLADAMKKMF